MQNHKKLKSIKLILKTELTDRTWFSLGVRNKTAFDYSTKQTETGFSWHNYTKDSVKIGANCVPSKHFLSSFAPLCFLNSSSTQINSLNYINKNDELVPSPASRSSEGIYGFICKAFTRDFVVLVFFLVQFFRSILILGEQFVPQMKEMQFVCFKVWNSFTDALYLITVISLLYLSLFFYE